MRVGKPPIYLIFLLLFLATVCSPADAISTENVLGPGSGLPYGGVGENYEIGLHDKERMNFVVGRVGNSLDSLDKNATYHFPELPWFPGMSILAWSRDF
jgi:hypothetical protein